MYIAYARRYMHQVDPLEVDDCLMLLLLVWWDGGGGEGGLYEGKVGEESIPFFRDAVHYKQIGLAAKSQWDSITVGLPRKLSTI